MGLMMNSCMKSSTASVRISNLWVPMKRGLRVYWRDISARQMALK